MYKCRHPNYLSHQLPMVCCCVTNVLMVDQSWEALQILWYTWLGYQLRLISSYLDPFFFIVEIGRPSSFHTISLNPDIKSRCLYIISWCKDGPTLIHISSSLRLGAHPPSTLSVSTQTLNLDVSTSYTVAKMDLPWSIFLHRWDWAPILLPNYQSQLRH